MKPVAVLVALAVTATPTAYASPPAPPSPKVPAPADFPDVDAYRATHQAAYAVMGPHPSMSGFVFHTPSGMMCRAALIDDGGASCTGPGVAAPPDNSVTASTLDPGHFLLLKPGDGVTNVLPVGSKLDTTHGIVCAVIADDEVACRTGYDCGTDPTKHPQFGIHGFVAKPGASWTF